MTSAPTSRDTFLLALQASVPTVAGKSGHWEKLIECCITLDGRQRSDEKLLEQACYWVCQEKKLEEVVQALKDAGTRLSKSRVSRLASAGHAVVAHAQLKDAVSLDGVTSDKLALVNRLPDAERISVLETGYLQGKELKSTPVKEVRAAVNNVRPIKAPSASKSIWTAEQLAKAMRRFDPDCAPSAGIQEALNLLLEMLALTESTVAKRTA